MPNPPKSFKSDLDKSFSSQSKPDSDSDLSRRDKPDLPSQNKPDLIKLESRSLSFEFASGKRLDIDLVEFKLQLEEYTKGKDNFHQFREDVVNLIKAEYDIEASVTEAWQIIQHVESVWSEFKKKVLEQQTLLSGTESIPSPSTR